MNMNIIQGVFIHLRISPTRVRVLERAGPHEGTQLRTLRGLRSSGSGVWVCWWGG